MIKIGCTGFPVNRKLYQTKFNVVEIDQFLDRAPRNATIEKWAKLLPSEFEFILCAPRLMTHSPLVKSRMSKPHHHIVHPPFSDSAALRKSFSEIQHACLILKSKIVVFELPANASPTADHIGRIQNFFKNISRNGVSFVLQPPRHWPASIVEGLSKSLDLTVAINPLKTEAVPKTSFRYFRISRGSQKEAFSSLVDEELNQIKKACGNALSYVIFNNGPSAFRDAQRFSILCNRS